jgi:hypothetical protein
MTNVFPKANSAELTTIDIVRDTLAVTGDGDVSFRCRVGRGSGKAVEVPASQFDEFVTLLVQTRDSRSALAQQQREADAARVLAATATTSASAEESSSSEGE